MPNKEENKKLYLLGSEASKWIFIFIFSLLVFSPLVAQAGTLNSAKTPETGAGLNRGLVGYWTMDSKDINWKANTINDKSGQVGTVYYNTVTVSGTLTPDATGIYTAAGMYNGVPYYQRGSDNYYIWLAPFNNNWYISQGVPISTNPGIYLNRWAPGAVTSIVTTYTPRDSATGNATVANNTSSGTYLFVPIPATLVGMSTTTSPVTGKIGQALMFNGSSGYIDLGADNITNLYGDRTALTVSLWVKRTGAADFVAQHGYWPNTGWYIRAGTNGVGIVGGGTKYEVGPSNFTPLNKWQHIVLVFKGGQYVNVYTDGVLNKTKTTSIPASFDAPASNNHVTLGKASYVSMYDNEVADDMRIYNRALSDAEIKQLYGQSSEKFNTAPVIEPKAATGLTAGLAAYWTMDSKDVNWRTNTISDKAGNNTGTMVSMSTTTSPAAGKIGQALQFNGTTGYIRATSTNSNLNISGNQMSISLWFYNKSLPTADTYLIRKGDKSTGCAYGTPYDIRLLNATKNVFFEIYNSSCTQIAAQALNLATLNKWHHVVGVYDGSFVYIYVDGLFSNKSAQTGNILSNDQDVGINTFIEDGTNHYNRLNGSLDDVRIYNRALSAKEVTQLYAQGADKFNTSPSVSGSVTKPTGINSGLVGYWTMDSKDINWKANTMAEKTGLVGTTYYNTINVSGTLSPDVTDTYTVAGMHNNLPYYKSNVTHDNGAGTQAYWYIWWDTASLKWWVTTQLDVGGATYWKNAAAGNPLVATLVNYGTATGNLTVANNTNSGTYYIAPIPATLVGMSTTTSPATGKIGQALKFNGTNGHIGISTINSLSDTYVTVSAWVRTSSPALQKVIDCRDSLNSTSGFYLNVDAGGTTEFAINDTMSAITTATVNNGRWHHLVGVYDKTLGSKNIKLFIDGVLAKTSNYTQAIVGTTLTPAIGSRYTGDNTFFNGSIDDVRVYNRALSAGEVLQLYNQGR